MPTSSVYKGLTPLHFTCLNGMRSVADFYLSERHLPVDMISPNSDVLWTPLQAVISAKGLDRTTVALSTAKWLIEEKGASITHTDIEMASEGEIREVHEYLIKRMEMERKARQKEKEEKRRLVERAAQADQAAEAFLVELETEMKEEDEKRKKKKEKNKKKKGGKSSEGVGKEEGGGTIEMKIRARVAVAAAFQGGGENEKENVSRQGNKE